MKPPTLTINEARNEVFLGKKEIHLAPKEFALLVEIKSAGVTVNRQHLIGTVWPADAAIDIDTRTIDQHIARLRQKIGRGLIATVPGYGYRWDGDKARI